ncbi:MAG TPA: helix-turn-helix transcriptional regulator [Thermoanaerobaculia bacterium]
MLYYEQIREARLAANLTISDVSRLTGIPRYQYKAFEDGTWNVTMTRLEKILDVIPNLPPLQMGKATLVTTRPELLEVHATVSALCATIDVLQAAAHQAKVMLEQKLKSPLIVEGRDPDVDPELIRKLTEEANRGKAVKNAPPKATAARRRVRNSQ